MRKFVQPIPFLPRDDMLAQYRAVRLSVRLSVCMSVRHNSVFYQNG